MKNTNGVEIKVGGIYKDAVSGREVKIVAKGQHIAMGECLFYITASKGYNVEECSCNTQITCCIIGATFLDGLIPKTKEA